MNRVWVVETRDANGAWYTWGAYLSRKEARNSVSYEKSWGDGEYRYRSYFPKEE